MDETLIEALRMKRARLNAAIAAHRALGWAAPAAVGAGLVVAALRALGVEAAGPLLWAASVLACAALGALGARKSRLDEAGTARWLDERLGDKELLSAALVCLGRGNQGRFDAQIVEQALALLPSAASIRPSARPLAKRAAIMAAGCVIGGYLIFLASPLASLGPRSQGSAQGGPGAGASTAKAASLAGGSEAAAAFASSLFPEDRRRATLAERALREGRLDDLRDMLKAADLDYGARLSRAVSELERKKLASERERIREAAQALSMAGQNGAEAYNPESGSERHPLSDGGDSPSYGQSRSGSPYPRGERGSMNRPGAGPGEGGSTPGGLGLAQDKAGAERGQGQNYYAEGGEAGGDEASPGAEGPTGHGRNYGVGSGSEGHWGAIRPAAGSGQAALGSSKDSSFFELVLPDREASSSIAALLPDSSKSAESAMSREGLPLEYEDFVRSYFLSLSQGQRP